MVSNEGRNNIIVLGVLIGFSILITSFIFTFVSNMEKATDEVRGEVSKGVVNVTTSQALQTQSIGNLTLFVNDLVELTIEERDTNKKNLGTFMGAFKNQSDAMVSAIEDLSSDSNRSRDIQTQKFVETLQESQNLTKISQNLTEARLGIEANQTEKLDALVNFFNVTLTPQINVTSNNPQ